MAVSAGFDAYERDPIGVLGVTNDGFTIIGEYFRQIVSELKIPFANFLEGGYNVQSLPNLLSAYISPFIQESQENKISNISLTPSQQTIATVNQSKNLLGDYWQL